MIAVSVKHPNLLNFERKKHKDNCVKVAHVVQKLAKLALRLDSSNGNQHIRILTQIPYNPDFENNQVFSSYLLEYFFGKFLHFVGNGNPMK